MAPIMKTLATFLGIQLLFGVILSGPFAVRAAADDPEATLAIFDILYRLIDVHQEIVQDGERNRAFASEREVPGFEIPNVTPVKTKKSAGSGGSRDVKQSARMVAKKVPSDMDGGVPNSSAPVESGSAQSQRE
jgi:hypothetical protein